MTQAALGRIVRVARGTVAAWETDVQVPSGENLLRLADALGAAPEDILHGDAVREPAPSYGEQPDVYRLVVRYLERVGPPGEGEALKRDFIEVEKRVRESRGEALPDWWYTLRGKVEE